MVENGVDHCGMDGCHNFAAYKEMSPTGVEKRAILHRHTYGIRRLYAQRPPDGHAKANDDQEDTGVAVCPQKRNAPSRQSLTTDAASEQRQDIRPCACHHPEFIRLQIRNFADEKTVYEDPYSAECCTEVLQQISQEANVADEHFF